MSEPPNTDALAYREDSVEVIEIELEPVDPLLCCVGGGRWMLVWMPPNDIHMPPEYVDCEDEVRAWVEAWPGAEWAEN